MTGVGIAEVGMRVDMTGLDMTGVDMTGVDMTLLSKYNQ